MWGFSLALRRLGNDLGFVPIVIGACGALYVAALVMDPRGIGMSGMNILSPSFHSLFVLGSSGAIPVFGYNRWWTLLSAGWLHGNLLRSEEHTSELQSQSNLVCRLLLEKKK